MPLVCSAMEDDRMTLESSTLVAVRPRKKETAGIQLRRLLPTHKLFASVK